MELFNNMIMGFQETLNWTTLFYCFIGVLLGMLVGVLPGIGALASISMLLPVTPPRRPSSCSPACTTARSTAAPPPPSC